MTLDRKKLAQILGMCGSAHDGERANAAKLADELVRAAGLTWPQVLDGGGAHESFELVRARRTIDILTMQVRQLERELSTIEAGIPTDRDFELLFAYAHRFTEWEQNFLDSICDQQYGLTDKQRDVLMRLILKAKLWDNRN